jgi:uncharacterized secreted protein with C-terminal beta-propeller domain
MQRKSKVFGSLLVLTLLAVSASVFLVPSPQSQIGQSGNLRSFDSDAQMRLFLLQNQNGFQNSIKAGIALQGVFNPSASSSAPSFTATNLQVEGVDEPDTVKTDGTYLYVVSTNRVFIILAQPPDKSAVVSRLDYKGQVYGIFLSGNRLLVIKQGIGNSLANFYSQAVNFLLYDVTDTSKPSLLNTISAEGSYVNSRLTSGFAYAVVQQPSWLPVENGNYTLMPPSVFVNGVAETLPPSQVYYNPNSAVPVQTQTIILSINIADGSHNEKAVLTGWGSTIYSSLSNIYLAFPDQSRYALGIMLPVSAGRPIVGIMRPIWLGGAANTTIFRIGFSRGDTQVAAEGTIPGTVLNQFSLDEYQGDLRIATTSYKHVPNQLQVQVNNVYVLDKNLKVVGSIEGLAPNERVYSVRFLGDMGYVVTFERIDPLFAISFADMTHPVVLSELKTTGFSDYLHPIGNGYLIGVGKDAVPAPNEVGFVLYLGLKLSLFHVNQNGSSMEVSRYLIGDRGSDSPVLTDHHAFLYDTAKGIMALPVLVAQVDKSQYAGNPPPFSYGQPVWQGAYLFNVSVSSGFKLIGTISHIPSGGSVGTNSDLYINRVVIIGNFVYTISNNLVLISNLPTLSTVRQIQLSG